MKLFSCQKCQQIVFFENVACTRCGHALAYLPDQASRGRIEPEDPAPHYPRDRWKTLARLPGAAWYRLCATPASTASATGRSRPTKRASTAVACRLTPYYPQPLDARAPWRPGTGWRSPSAAALHAASRSGCRSRSRPTSTRTGSPSTFLQDDRRRAPRSSPATTTASSRSTSPRPTTRSARRRASQLGEPYRTLLGHFRHEIGHYYWDRLIDETPAPGTRFRELFGDERADYDEALQAPLRAGPPRRLGQTLRQRLRDDAPVGGLGRDLGPLPAHGRHARDGAQPTACRCSPRRSAARRAAQAASPPRSSIRVVRRPDRRLDPADRRAQQPEPQHGPATSIPSCCPSRRSRSCASCTTWWRGPATKRRRRKSSRRGPRAGVPRYSEALSTRSRKAATVCAAIALGACYQTSSLRLSVRSCLVGELLELANEVFFAAGYIRVPRRGRDGVHAARAGRDGRANADAVGHRS